MGILNVDLIIFVSLVFVYNKLKQQNPNMLFLGEGVSVFLPPEEKDYKDLVQTQVKNSKKGGKKPLMPMKIMKAKSDFFSKYPLAVEVDIAIMLIVCILVQFVLSELIRRVIQFSMPDFAEKDMSITFSLGLSVLLLLLTYYCKSVKMAGWKSSETKTAFLIAIVSSLLILTLFFGFKEVMNFDFVKVVADQRKHLQYVFASAEQIDFSIEVFQIGCVFLNAIATFSFVPTIIRFASCYSSNLRKTIESKARKLDAEEREAESKKNDDIHPFLIDQTQQEENLENLIEKQTNTEVPRHKQNMLFFNLSLVLHLLSIILWIQPVVSIATSQLGKNTVDLFLQPLRLTLIIAQSILLLLTVRYQLQMFMMKSFDYLKSLANDSNEATYVTVKYKTSAYIQSCMHAGFQILVFIVIPLLISLLIIYRCYVSPSRSLPELVPTDAAATALEPGVEFFKTVFNNIKLYSVFNTKFIEITLSFWLFNYQVITYILKIVFIIITRQSHGV